jgi:hypothetical protein
MLHECLIIFLCSIAGETLSTNTFSGMELLKQYKIQSYVIELRDRIVPEKFINSKKLNQASLQVRNAAEMSLNLVVAQFNILS